MNTSTLENSANRVIACHTGLRPGQVSLTTWAEVEVAWFSAFVDK